MLPVFAEGNRVGDVLVDEEGPFLRYSPTWQNAPQAFPVSLSMPLSKLAWSTDRAAPWLMNLLPEGQPLRAMTRALGLAAEDLAGIIAAAGRDLAGALTFQENGPGAGHVAIPGTDALERIMEERARTVSLNLREEGEEDAAGEPSGGGRRYEG